MKDELTNTQKKRNTIIFIIVGTLFNVALSMALIFGFVLLGMFILEEKVTIAIPFLFIGAVILGMFIYQKLAAFIIKKWNLEDKLEPFLFKRHSSSKKKH